MCFLITGAVDSNLGKEVPRSFFLRFKANSVTANSELLGVLNLVSKIRYQGSPEDFYL